MENASKALIIAGAILLSILIIGLGMFIYQQAAGQINDTGLDSTARKAYNSEFTQYEGEKTGSEVKMLCDVIRNHNLANTADNGKIVVLCGNKTTLSTALATDATKTDASAAGDMAPQIAANVTKIKGLISSTSKYTVSIGYTTTGYVKFINIQPKV